MKTLTVGSLALALCFTTHLAAQPNEKETLEVNVKQRGAIGDGVADDTAAIQGALNGGQRTVIIPSGTYKISAALKVDSGTTIQADAQAVIRLADHAGNDVGLFLLTNRDFTGGNTDIKVDGGIWDGNNEHNERGRPDQMPCYTGAALNFINVHQLALRNLTVRNPDAYAIRACKLADFTIENIGFDFSVTRPNQDGVHLDGFCERGVIRNLRALSPYATNDDMVALNADDGSAADYVIQQGMVQGPIRNILVEHLRAESAFTFVRLLSHRELIENVTVRDVVGGCRFYAINMDRWRFPAGGGNIRNVTLRDFTIRKMPDHFSKQAKPDERPLIHIQTVVQGLRIENFCRQPDDKQPARSLVLDNGQANQLRLEGLTAEQVTELQALSPTVKPEMFSAQPGQDARTLLKGDPGQVILPAGGFSLLEINPDHSETTHVYKADAAPAGAQGVSYNGLPVPAEWPPKVTISRQPLAAPSYLVAPPMIILIDVGRQLFVDDFLIENTTLARIHHLPEYHVSNPVLGPEKPWEKDHAAPFSDGVWFDAKDGFFKMFYWARGTVEGKTSNSTCLATSRDGIHWDRPAFDVVPGTNIVFLEDPELPRNSGTVWLDAAENDPARRFKMFQNLRHKQAAGESGGWRLRVSFSNDGIHWKSAGDSDHAADRSTVFYNPFRRSWVASLRRADNVVGRYRAYYESADPLDAMHWETAAGKNRSVDWVGADELDPDRLDLPLRRVPERPWDLPPSQLYNLDCVAYESVLLGLFSICRGHQVPPLAKINEVCVGFSRDGFQWWRPLRRPFCPLKLNQPGWNSGNLQSSGGCCLIVGDKLHFYVGAVPNGSRFADPGNVGLAILRRDGFTSLHADATPGAILTRPVMFNGRHLFVNAACSNGELRAEVLDDKNHPIEPFTAANSERIRIDSTRVALHWKGAADLSPLIGQTVRFRFHLTNGDLYAFWVSPEPTGASHGYVGAGGPGFTGPVDNGTPP